MFLYCSRHEEKGRNEWIQLKPDKETRAVDEYDHTNPPHNRAAVEFDFKAYLPFLEDNTIPDIEKKKLIEAVWSIVLTFVDIGFDVHPVQHVLNARNAPILPQENALNSPELSTIQADSGVELSQSVITKFVTAADTVRDAAREGFDT